MPVIIPEWSTVSALGLPPARDEHLGLPRLPAFPPSLPVSSLCHPNFLPFSLPVPGFQVKVLREDGRAAFRLFETQITQVLHFSREERRVDGGVVEAEIWVWDLLELAKPQVGNNSNENPFPLNSPSPGLWEHGLPSGAERLKWQDPHRALPRAPGLPFSDVFCLISSGKDAKASVGQTRNFLVRASCRLRLEPNKEYLIMGLDGVTSDLKGE